MPTRKRFEKRALGTPVLLCVVLLACEAARSSSPSGNKIAAHSVARGTGAIIPADRGRALLDQCTRTTPSRVSGYWTPSAAMIDSLEARLPAVLDPAITRAAPDGITPSNSSEYYRQYIGIERRGGLRTIYVNGFHQHYVRSRARPTDISRAVDTLSWRTVPVTVCDGGSHFFGVEYDHQSKKFTVVTFNDRVGG